MSDPQRGIVANCLVTEVYDGDTMTVELRIPVRVRLLDCWAPEIRTKDDKEKEAGLEARDNLIAMAEGRHGLVTIPWEGARRLDDVFTFGRVLADVIIDGESVAENQVRDKLASTTKGGKLGE